MIPLLNREFRGSGGESCDEVILPGADAAFGSVSAVIVRGKVLK